MQDRLSSLAGDSISATRFPRPFPSCVRKKSRLFSILEAQAIIFAFFIRDFGCQTFPSLHNKDHKGSYQKRVMKQ
jgi:hypothetical protein